MSLSADLISQFVKATNDSESKERNNIVYGTVVSVGDEKFVLLDGNDEASGQLTPISTVTDLVVGDRVCVEINNHKAIVSGNMTAPNERSNLGADGKTLKIDDLIAGRIDTDLLVAASGEFGKIQSKYAEIKDLDVENLTAKYADIDTLKAKTAFITNLEGGSIHFNCANFDEATFESFFAQSGIIKDLDINGATVSGKLVGVTIKGDLIEGGTIVADKLIIRTPNGLLYKLNAEALGDAGLAQIEDKTTLQNGLHGAIINDKTIVANKINVDDLVAFDATIAGFNIKKDTAIDGKPGRLYSGSKGSIDSDATPGVYLDDTGQMNIGDASNFIKFYRYYKLLTVEPSNWSTTYRSYFSKIDDKYVRLSSDTAPTFEADKYYEAIYKLAVSADEVMFGSSKKNLQTALNEVANSSISDVDVEYCKSASSTELLYRKKVEGIKTARQRDLKGDNVSIKLQSDNLLLLPYDNNFSNSMPSSDETVTLNGVTFKPNPDGSVSIWGTASKKTNYSLRNYHNSPSETTRIFVKQGTYTLGINTTNESKRGSVRIYSNKYTGPGTVAIYNGEPQTFTLDKSSEDTLGTFGITVTTDFQNVTEDSPVIAYPIFNEGATLKDFTTPKYKSLTDLTSFIPKQNCIVSINGVAGKLLLDENDTVIINNSLSTIYVDAILQYRVVLSVLLNMDNPQWTTSSPKWEEGSYIWSRTKTTNAENKISYSDPVCITGNPGQGVKSITEQYYLSTSEEEPVGGTWSDQQDPWSIGHYIWTRSVIIWSNGQRTETDPILATSLNEANARAEQATSDAETANNSANDAKTAADSAYSEVVQLKNKMITLVANKDGTTSFVQSASGWNFNFSDLTKSIEDMSKKTAYIDIDETNSGNPRMLFGKVNADSKLELTNETISFIIGSEIPTRITNEGMDTDRINIDNELLIGGFVLKKRPTGHVGFTWKGVDS